MPKRKRPGMKARKPKASQEGFFEVEEVSPPPESLGIHSLPPRTHNGDSVSVRTGFFEIILLSCTCAECCGCACHTLEWNKQMGHALAVHVQNIRCLLCAMLH